MLIALVAASRQPSARELLEIIEAELGVKARWDVRAAVNGLRVEGKQPRALRDYLESLIESGDLAKALRGEEAPNKEAESGIDALIHQSKAYRESPAFAEMVRFMAKFRDYSPYNNMLVRLQNPACSFFATERDWQRRFGSELKDEARPMVILAPMHPVLLVYDLDQVDNPPLPKELEDFATFAGEFDAAWLEKMVGNAGAHDRIRVDFKNLSKSLAGFATTDRPGPGWKMRIAIHDGLDGASKFGVLCHELAHIYLGHLGSDRDHWWPVRYNLDRHSCEVEAEAVAFLVTWRLGLRGSSAPYVSRHLKEGKVPAGVSIDHVAKVAGRIERMATQTLAKRSPKPAAKPAAK